MEGCCHLIVPPPPTAAAEKLQGGGESTRWRAGGARGPGHQPELWLQLRAAQGTFYGQTGQGDHCSKPARVVHLAGQELPPANSGLEAAGMRGPTRTARQGAARPGTPSTVQMEAGDVGSRNAVSDPAQAKHGPILSPPGAEPGPGSPRAPHPPPAAGSPGCPFAPLLRSLLPKDLSHPLSHTGSQQAGKGRPARWVC